MIVYKIKHIDSGKFVRVRLTSEGAKVWKDKHVIGGHPAFGKVLHSTHDGWKTPPDLTAEDLQGIGCRIVKYEITEIEL